MGLRDSDAWYHFGTPDLFALGNRIYLHLRSVSDSREDLLRRPGQWKRAARTLSSYARGLLFVAPMALQIAAVLLLGYSLWAWLYFTEAQATVVALGTLLSFVVTGGFVQSIGRVGHLYHAQETPSLAYKACHRLVGLGMFTVAGVTLFFLLSNLLCP